MRKNLIWLILLVFFPTLATAFSFPEIGFCPLGGPPGWFNRMSGQHQKRYYPPPPIAFPVLPPKMRYYGAPPAVMPIYPPQYPSSPNRR